jgi:hypothetical protein
MPEKPELEAAFGVVADWFEAYFESLDPIVGRSFSQALRTYSDLATSSRKHWGEEWRRRVDELDAAADRQLMEFFLHYLNAKGYRVGSDLDGRINLGPSEN